ncbi:TrmB family transcriptional regulator [Candidatus Harpocratesius sp.]
MSTFIDNLQKFEFTQYEAQVIDTLVRYNQLKPAKLAQLSRVPQSKIYEVVNRLEEKGFVFLITEGKSKIIQIKPKQYIREKFDNQFKNYQSIYRKIIEQLDALYLSEKNHPVSIIGVAGRKQIEEQLIHLVEQANISIIGVFPPDLLTSNVIKAINEQKKPISIDLIFNSNKEYQQYASRIQKRSNLRCYLISSKDRAFIQNARKKVPKLLPPKVKESLSFQLYEGVLEKLDNHMGLVIVDKIQSLFLIPIPIETPLAVISYLPDLVEFHNQSLTQVIKSAVLL